MSVRPAALLKNLHQVPPSINGVYCQDIHRNEQVGITDVKEAPQKPERKTQSALYQT